MILLACRLELNYYSIEWNKNLVQNSHSENMGTELDLDHIKCSFLHSKTPSLKEPENLLHRKINFIPTSKIKTIHRP